MSSNDREPSDQGTSGEPRVLSSGLTFIYKYVFSTYMIGATLAGSVAFFFIYTHLGVKMDPPVSVWYPLLVIPALLLSTGFTYFWCALLKKVRISGDHLLISNWRREIKVPLQDIRKITEFRGTLPRMVFVSFRNPTGFGRRISFLAKTKWLNLSFMSQWTRDPIVEELRQRVREAGRNLE